MSKRKSMAALVVVSFGSIAAQDMVPNIGGALLLVATQLRHAKVFIPLMEGLFTVLGNWIVEILL